jgi:hypothetical protein
VDYTTDPEGSVSIIDLSSGAANTTVTTSISPPLMARRTRCAMPAC